MFAVANQSEYTNFEINSNVDTKILAHQNIIVLRPIACNHSLRTRYQNEGSKSFSCTKRFKYFFSFIISIHKIKVLKRTIFKITFLIISNETDLRILSTVIVESHHITLVQLCCLKAPSVHEESLLVFMGRQKASCPKMAQR